jgi:predicted MPP superfamily phosphohydrolase
LAGFVLCALGVPAYTRWIEPGRLVRRQYRVPLSNGSEVRPLKLLHLSDLHASAVVSLRHIARAIHQGLDWQPDLICLTGDFITAHLDSPEEYGAVLAPLARAAPTFACLGNHDGGRWAQAAGGYADTALVQRLLDRSGIQLLHNTARTIELTGWRLRLVGVGDLWAGELDASRAFAGVGSTPDRTTLVLAHNPDAKQQLQRYPWHLLLAGHTHGGQLRLPILGTPFAPVEDKRFVAGLHRWQDRWLHISEGVGNVYGLRFNCPPTISLLTLV